MRQRPNNEIVGELTEELHRFVDVYLHMKTGSKELADVATLPLAAYDPLYLFMFSLLLLLLLIKSFHDTAC